MMRVAYVDVGFSTEQYGLEPTRYGGGAVVARYLKQDPEVDMVLIAPTRSFDNCVASVDRGSMVGLDDGHCIALQRGHPISDVLGFIGGQFDLVLHGHTCFTLGRGSYRGPIVHWSGFDGSAGHPANDYILLYDPSFRAQFGERAKYVRIGKPVPEQCPGKPNTTERPFVFQCSRHDDHMPSIPVAKACLAAGIKAVFAGPIHNGYPLLDHIDGVNTVYLGEIGEAEKLDLYRRARLVTLLAEWDLPFSQTIIEAQGQGTPIYVNQRGPFLATYLKRGVNGFAATPDMTLAAAYEWAPYLDRQDCWAAAREYDVSVMTRTFKQAFNEIVAEWRALHT